MCQKMNRNENREYLEDGGKIQFDRMINKKANIQKTLMKMHIKIF